MQNMLEKVWHQLVNCYGADRCSIVVAKLLSVHCRETLAVIIRSERRTNSKLVCTKNDATWGIHHATLGCDCKLKALRFDCCLKNFLEAVLSLYTIYLHFLAVTSSFIFFVHSIVGKSCATEAHFCAYSSAKLCSCRQFIYTHLNLLCVWDSQTLSAGGKDKYHTLCEST